MSTDLIDNLQSARDRLMPKVTACWGDAFDGDFDSMLDAINAMKRYAANIEQDRAAFRQLTEQRAALLEALAGLVSAVSWERHGECRSPGWPGPPPKVTDALEEARAAIALVQGDAA